MSWAHNLALGSPPFLLTTFMIIIFTNSSEWQPPGLGPLEGSRSSANYPPPLPREARGAVHRRLRHQSLFLEPDSTVTSWELGERCLGVEGAVPTALRGSPTPWAGWKSQVPDAQPASLRGAFTSPARPGGNAQAHPTPGATVPPRLVHTLPAHTSGPSPNPGGTELTLNPNPICFLEVGSLDSGSL